MGFDISAMANLEKLEEYAELDLDTKARLLRGIAQIVREDIERRFAASPRTSIGGYVYPATLFWEPLSPGYLKANPNRKVGQVYIDTGNTRDSLIKENANGNLTNIDPENITVEIGSQLEHVTELHEKRQIFVDHAELRNLIQAYILKFLSEEFVKK